MRSRKAGFPFATRAWKPELSRTTRTENFLSQNFFPSFSENHFFPRFILPCSLLAENIFFGFSKSAPTPRYTILDSRFPPVMRSRKAGFPFLTRAWKPELSRTTRTENFLSQNFFPNFSENHFFPRFMLPCSLLAENIFFGFSKSTPTPRYTILDSRFPPVM